MYINRATLYGNLTRDPELKSLPSGIQVCNLGLATNRSWKDKNGAKQESTEYHNVVVFGKQAEIIKQYVHKGDGLYVEGRLQTRSWDGPDGVKKYRTEIILDNFQFGNKRSGGGPYSSEGSQASPSSEGTDAPAPDDAGEIAYPEEDINPEDIPF